jgi:hypothetical protein
MSVGTNGARNKVTATDRKRRFENLKKLSKIKQNLTGKILGL